MSLYHPENKNVSIEWTLLAELKPFNSLEYKATTHRIVSYQAGKLVTAREVIDLWFLSWKTDFIWI